jgi:flagellar biosynthesis/type III secretory pathway protein FliH
LRLEADETIQPGGCIIETQLGDVDARIDQQIKVLEDLLTTQLPKIAIEG